MRPTLALPLAAVLALLSACDSPKPRPASPPPAASIPPKDAAAAAAAPAAPAPAALSAGLPKRPEPAGYYLDQIGKAANPASQTPVVTDNAGPLLIAGFAYDGVTKAPGAGVDVVIDGVARPATYNVPRQDVADFFKNPKLAAVGFNLSLPPGTLTPGEHKLTVRVVTADGAGFFESPEIAFTVR